MGGGKNALAESKKLNGGRAVFFSTLPTLSTLSTFTHVQNVCLQQRDSVVRER